MRVAVPLGLIGILCTAPAAAQEVGSGFRYISSEIGVLSLGGSREAYALETLVTGDGEGPGAELHGRCLVSGERDGRSHRGQGTCFLADGAGGTLVLRIEERADGPAVLTEGRGAWTGQAGRFAGHSGTMTYSLVTYGLGRPGVIEGTGQARWTGLPASPGPEVPEAPRLELRPSATDPP